MMIKAHLTPSPHVYPRTHPPTYPHPAVSVDPPPGWASADVAVAPVPAKLGGLSVVVVGFSAAAALADAQAR